MNDQATTVRNERKERERGQREKGRKERKERERKQERRKKEERERKRREKERKDRVSLYCFYAPWGTIGEFSGFQEVCFGTFSATVWLE